MACQKIGRVLRNAYKFVDEDMLTVADKVIAATGRVKTLSHAASVQEIEAMLGTVGSEVGEWLSAGMDKIYDLEVSGKALAEKFKVALDKTVTQYGVDGAVVKIAGVSTGIGDGRGLPSHIYDQSVNVAIARTKVAD